MLEYTVRADSIDARGSLAVCKDASMIIDTDMSGREDAFNPAELLLAALAGCLIKGIERALPLLKFSLSGVTVEVHATRQDAPPRIAEITYRIAVDTEESDHRIDLLHRNARKYGTISNTLAGAVLLEGTMVRGTELSAAGSEDR